MPRHRRCPALCFASPSRRGGLLRRPAMECGGLPAAGRLDAAFVRPARPERSRRGAAFLRPGPSNVNSWRSLLLSPVFHLRFSIFARSLGIRCAFLGFHPPQADSLYWYLAAHFHNHRHRTERTRGVAGSAIMHIARAGRTVMCVEESSAAGGIAGSLPVRWSSAHALANLSSGRTNS